MECFSSYGADKLKVTFGHVTSLIDGNGTAAYWNYFPSATVYIWQI